MVGHPLLAAHPGAMSPGLAAALTAGGMLFLFLIVCAAVWTVRMGRADEQADQQRQAGQDVARRCSIGCANWPDHPDFAACPTCGEPTTRIYDAPMNLDEGRRILSAVEFERQIGWH